MWMSNDCVPLKNVESPYGGWVSALLGAAGEPPPAMFPVAPALLAEEPQLGPWQVAVESMRPLQGILLDNYPCAAQNRHRPMDIYELPDSLAHTVGEGGPVGPEVKEPLALLVLDHADPAGQHAVIQNTVVEGTLLAQKLKNHLRCWYLIMLTLLARMLLSRMLRVCWSIYLRSRSRP